MSGQLYYAALYPREGWVLQEIDTIEDALAVHAGMDAPEWKILREVEVELKEVKDEPSSVDD